MLTTTGWFRCIHCGHLVNPRSERCEVPHDLCTPTGCEPPQAAELHALVADPAAPADTVLRAFAAAATGTLYLFDIASYQAGIDLDAVAAAGWDIANIKTSQGNWYTFGDALMYARAAKARGMGVSTFHWIDNSASGRAQADYAWRTLGPIIAAVGPVAHIVDEEDSAAPASYQHLADYVARIRELMGHLPAMYTGDWYATSGGRAGWNVAALTPWLMSAPNAGYLGSYPGDQSPHWGAGYWGYGDLAAMQFAVSPIPGAGGGSISKTAIRDPGMWAAITGGDDMALTPEEHDALIELRDRMRWVDPRVEGMAGLQQPSGGPPKGQDLPFVKAVAADEARDAGLAAALTSARAAIAGLVDAVKAGGGSVEAAALIAKMDEIAAAESATVAGLRDQLTAVQARLDDSQARLAAAVQAQADALRSNG